MTVGAARRQFMKKMKSGSAFVSFLRKAQRITHGRIQAQDGFDALEQLQGQTFDLIISHLRMPRMSGIELLKAVRHRFPTIALILASGDCEDYGALDGRIADAFYVKGSHQPQELLHTVAKVISSSPRSLSF